MKGRGLLRVIEREGIQWGRVSEVFSTSSSEGQFFLFGDSDSLLRGEERKGGRRDGRIIGEDDRFCHDGRIDGSKWCRKSIG